MLSDKAQAERTSLDIKEIIAAVKADWAIEIIVIQQHSQFDWVTNAWRRNHVRL